MIDLAIDIVITVIIFMVLAYAFVTIFGAPTCESVANQTAMNLRSAINEVVDSKPSFQPSDPSSTEPSNPDYFTTAPIRLCQQHTYTSHWILQFVGGMPEYQIYYEHFPEGGWLWNEAYPWSGGALSTFIFWGVMRGATAVSGIAGRLSTAYIGFKAVQFVNQMSSVSRFLNSFVNFAADNVEYGKIVMNLVASYSPPKIIQSGRQLKNFTDLISNVQSNYILKYMGDAELANVQWDTGTGTAKYEAVGDKIVLKNQDVPMLFTRTVPNGNGYAEVTEEIYVRCEGCNGVLDPDTATWNDVINVSIGKTIQDAAPSDWQQYAPLTINPSQQMKDYYDSIKDSQPETAQQISEDFAFDNTGSFISDNASNSSFMKRINDANQERINSINSYLDVNSYNSPTADNSHTMQTTDEILWRVKAIKNITNSPPDEVIGSDGVNPIYAQEFKDDILTPMLNHDDIYKFKGKIRTYASSQGIPISPEVEPEDAVNVLESMWENEGGGFVFYNDGDFTNIFVRVKDTLVNSTCTASVNDIIGNVTELKNFNTYPGFVKYENHNRIRDIANYLKTLCGSIYSTAATNQEKYNNFSFGLELYMLKNLVVELNRTENNFYGADNQDIKPMVESQLGMIIGLFDMNDNAAKVNLWPRSIPIQVAKMVFEPITAYFAPNSWLGKGLILTQMTQKCRGNSICLYVQASQYEGPYYMDENATSYTVRSWRPITWQQFAGLTAIEMHIPAHPRFYVVSPCFAVAKIWKTDLNGNPTVFVHPIKVDLHGEKSNYCYADEGLINEYVGIWGASEALKVAEIIVGPEEGLLSDVLKEADPITLVQGMAEAAISWPGYPYTDLNYTDMQSGSKYYTEYQQLSEALQNEYG